MDRVLVLPDTERLVDKPGVWQVTCEFEPDGDLKLWHLDGDPVWIDRRHLAKFWRWIREHIPEEDGPDED